MLLLLSLLDTDGLARTTRILAIMAATRLGLAQYPLLRQHLPDGE
jgi:hypothetical protein